MTGPRFCEQPTSLIRRFLLPVILYSLLFASSAYAKDAGRWLDCYQCEDTQYTGSKAHSNDGDARCASSSLPKTFLVNRTEANGFFLPSETEGEKIVCEVMLTILEHAKDPKIKTYILTRDLTTESYYDQLDKKQFPMTMKPGEKLRCVQLGKDTDKFVWKTCYCFTSACNDISFEKLRDMKIVDTYEAPPIYTSVRYN